MSRRVARSLAPWLFALVVTFGPVVSLGIWFWEGHGASLTRMSQVRPGMTREHVIKLLGRPSTINHSQDGSESWFYGRWTWCQVKVSMARKGTVIETDHDH